ncbi:MAG: hypothetical protein JNM56_27145, partial [Planctomycetia bacterium]|nr:hypothetical protein [Planctomycetia bacterium]
MSEKSPGEPDGSGAISAILTRTTLPLDSRYKQDADMAIWNIARKDFRLLLRDRRALIILLAMPFIFILILGISLGEGFGQKPDDRLRVSLVDLDRGEPHAAA